MTRRVILGKRGVAYGLWVSRPGIDVLTASEDDLLLSMDTENLQIVASGIAADPGNTGSRTITIPALGFKPYVIYGCNRYLIELRHNSNTSITFQSMGSMPKRDNDADGRIRWAVTNIPI